MINATIYLFFRKKKRDLEAIQEYQKKLNEFELQKGFSDVSTDAEEILEKRISIKDIDEESEDIKKLDLKDLTGHKLFTIEEEDTLSGFEEVESE